MTDEYPRVLRNFSRDGNSFELEYAHETVQLGSIVVGVLGANCVVLGAEKKTLQQRESAYTMQKINIIDENIGMAFAGITADARVVISRSKGQCEKYRTTHGMPAPVENIVRFIAEMKEKFTRSIGLRPFAVSCLFAGFDVNGRPHLYETDPSGSFCAWMATAIGRNNKTVRQFLEMHYSENAIADADSAVKLALKGLLQVAENGTTNLVIGVLEHGNPMKILDHQALMDYVAKIETEKNGKVEKKKK